MKIVLTPLTTSRGTAPGYRHCVYCNQFKRSRNFDRGMCPECAKKNEKEALSTVFEEGFASIHEKLDIILGKLPAKAKPKPKADKGE